MYVALKLICDTENILCFSGRMFADPKTIHVNWNYVVTIFNTELNSTYNHRLYDMHVVAVLNKRTVSRQMVHGQMVHRQMVHDNWFTTIGSRHIFIANPTSSPVQNMLTLIQLLVWVLIRKFSSLIQLLVQYELFTSLIQRIVWVLTRNIFIAHPAFSLVRNILNTHPTSSLSFHTKHFDRSSNF